MIAYLRGRVAAKSLGAVVLEVGGVGYHLTVTPELSTALKEGDEAKLLVYEQIREDAYTLYGFADEDSRLLFAALVGVSGVGPKGALGVMSAGSAAHIRDAIAAGDLDLLEGVSGIGKKTAQRIIIELKGKLELGEDGPAQDPAYQALVGLGYTPAQAAAAVRSIPRDVKGDQERIKVALRSLGK